MSKNKLIHLISERSFECLQRLSIATYVNSVKNELFDFDSYFELTYKHNLKYIMEFVKYNDIDKFRSIYYNYSKIIYDMSVQFAYNYVNYKDSDKSFMFNWWHLNKKNYLGEIISIL